MTSIPTHAHGADAYDPSLPPHERPEVAMHFRSLQDQNDAGKLGMWLFLTTEILLFAGFFCAYAVFRMLYPEAFAGASHHYLSWQIGAINTAVLLFSSFTVAWSIHNAQRNQQGLLRLNLILTILCGMTFLVLKLWLEYLPKIRMGELPGLNFTYPNATFDQEPIFLSIYWVSTATHGLHVLIGVLLFVWLLVRSFKLHFGPKSYLALENVGLYWHLVDLIWIFLFPLLYLI